MRFNMMRVILCVFCLWGLPLSQRMGSSPVMAQDADVKNLKRDLHFDSFKTIPIQHGGRIKPLDTFAREVVQTVTGKTTFGGLSSVDLIFSWMMLTGQWADTSMIEISSRDLKEKLGFPLHRKYFSALEILKTASLSHYFSSVQEKNAREEKLSPLDKALERLSLQLSVLEGVSAGGLLTIIPHPAGAHESWFSLAPMDKAEAVYSNFDSRTKIEELGVTLQGVFQSYQANDSKTFSLTTTKFKQLLSELSTGSSTSESSTRGYPYVEMLSKEVFYNEFRPFQKAWILYVFSFALFLVHFISQRKFVWGGAGFVSAVSAFFIHIFGFYLRCSVTGRPPVGTMYESVVWVSLGIVFFAFVLFYFYKNLMIVMVASVVASLGLILSDNLPLVLDPTIRPLTPVLRSNFWLTIHVLTITLSYAAFALALGIGNWGLFKFFLHRHRLEEVQKLSSYIYRSIQIGVLLLASGTILGGVWADYSWGRFWGWDPKEVWALIALLLYLAIVHGKYSGWLKDFGLISGSVLAFQGVLMAWYGVNFVLGVGLHSYGFGSGGLPYVLTYVFLQIVFVVLSWMKYRRRVCAILIK